MYHNTVKYGDASTIFIGVIAGSAIGGAVGGILGSDDTYNVAPYIIGGIVAGGVLGFLITYEDERKVYIFDGLPWEERIEILNSIISSKYATIDLSMYFQ